MLDFERLVNRAKTFNTRFQEHSSHHVGCFGFFSSFTQSDCVWDHAYLIQTVALLLDKESDNLLNSLKRINEKPDLLLTDIRVKTFKTYVLIGVYCYIWAHYDSSILKYANQNLVNQIKNDLRNVFSEFDFVDSIQDIDGDLWKLALHDFSVYCSHIYSHSDNDIEYQTVYSLLGDDIEGTIQMMRSQRDVDNDNDNDSGISSYLKLFNSCF